jgi:hypothetical protein
MPTASQATSSKATLRRFHDAMNTGDAETISKTIDQTEGETDERPSGHR